MAETFENGHVLLVKSDKMGSGPDELGAILMKGFMSVILEVDPLPETIIFYNSGIHLAVEGSPVLDALKELESRGVRILVCGTCLNYFEKKDYLKAGRVSNMHEIAETLTRTRHIVTP